MSYTDKKLKYINRLMDEVNDLVDNIYEGLVDDDFEAVREASIALEALLKEILNSINNV
jgi:DNA-binding PadR family transcriptional regulator